MFSTLRTTFLSLCCAPARRRVRPEADHREFDATLNAPYHGEPAPRRAAHLQPGLRLPAGGRAADRQLGARAGRADGRVARQWSGEQPLFRARSTSSVRWDGRFGSAAAPAGIYRVRLQAASRAAGAERGRRRTRRAKLGDRGRPRRRAGDAGVPRAAAAPGDARHGAGARRAAVQRLPRQPAQPDRPQRRRRRPRHLHRRAGSAKLDAAARPTPSRTRATHGLDMLVASEHNHMYDGSAGTNAAATPAAATALYRSGLKAAADFNAAHPDFLAVYGARMGRDRQRRPPEHLQQRRAARLGTQRRRRAAGRTLTRKAITPRCTR